MKSADIEVGGEYAISSTRQRGLLGDYDIPRMLRAKVIAKGIEHKQGYYGQTQKSGVRVELAGEADTWYMRGVKQDDGTYIITSAQVYIPWDQFEENYLKPYQERQAQGNANEKAVDEVIDRLTSFGVTGVSKTQEGRRGSNRVMRFAVCIAMPDAEKLVELLDSEPE